MRLAGVHRSVYVGREMLWKKGQRSRSTTHNGLCLQSGSAYVRNMSYIHSLSYLLNLFIFVHEKNNRNKIHCRKNISFWSVSLLPGRAGWMAGLSTLKVTRNNVPIHYFYKWNLWLVRRALCLFSYDEMNARERGFVCAAYSVGAGCVLKTRATWWSTAFFGVVITMIIGVFQAGRKRFGAVVMEMLGTEFKNPRTAFFWRKLFLWSLLYLSLCKRKHYRGGRINLCNMAHSRSPVDAKCTTA